MGELKGLDVSEFQGKPNWSKVKKDGIKFAILKIGNIADVDKIYIDTEFERNYKECKKLGIPVGAYVYNYCNEISNLERETKEVIKAIAGKFFEIGVFLDMEDKTIKVENRGTLTEQVNVFTRMLNEAGYKAGVYASLNWLENELNPNNFDKEVIVWVAQYYKECQYEGKYEIWQYSSSGQVSGINGRVDMNIGYFDIDELIPEPTNINVLDWQKVMNKVYGCGILEDNKFEEYSKKCAMKHYLHYTMPTIKNKHVEFMQKQLKRHGYNVEIDGSFGPDCEAKTKQFQKDHGLTADGYIGADTTQELLK